MKLGKKTLQELKNKKISIEDLYDRYFVDPQDKIETENILKVLNENICSFQKIVDKFQSMKDHNNDSCLYALLANTGLFEELIKNNRLNKEDTRYLLSTFDNIYELDRLCWNTPLIKHILNEFVLNKKDVYRFNTMIENDYWCEDMTVFDLIEYANKNNDEILKLNELNEKVYVLNSFDLNENQKDELIELIKNNEIARNRMIQIVENNLESQFDFESLMSYLKKLEKKSVLNI